MAAPVIVGVGGGVACYKATEVVRALGRANYQISVLPTAAANQFVSPILWESLSGNPVYTDVFAPGAGVAHIELARQAQAIVIVAATADLLAKMAAGLAVDMLGNVLLAATCPIIVAPAMHWQMWEHPATVKNVQVLRQRGIIFIEPEIGELSCGDTGRGRLADPQLIIEKTLDVLRNTSSYSNEAADNRHIYKENTEAGGSSHSGDSGKVLKNADLDRGQKTRRLGGKRILVTAGGTREYLDPVRYIGNRSTGTMGVLLANALFNLGAQVSLVAANLESKTAFPLKGIKTIPVVSAEDMYQAVEAEFPETDLLIMAAAVADYRPEKYSHSKLKKRGEQGVSISLVQNPDILASFSNRSNGQQLVIGFAAETGTEEEILAYGKVKIARKKCDYIMLNQVGEQAGFGDIETAITVLSKDGEVRQKWRGSKLEITAAMADFIADLLDSENC